MKDAMPRKCFKCGTIVAWIIPSKRDAFGILNNEVKTLPNFAAYPNKYCCKNCEAKLKQEKVKGC